MNRDGCTGFLPKRYAGVGRAAVISKLSLFSLGVRFFHFVLLSAIGCKRRPILHAGGVEIRELGCIFFLCSSRAAIFSTVIHKDSTRMAEQRLVARIHHENLSTAGAKVALAKSHQIQSIYIYIYRHYIYH